MPGVRKRLLGDGCVDEPAASSASGSLLHGRSVRHRLLAEELDLPAPEQPLTQALKRDWAKGILNARQIQEYAAKAQAQGAVGLERLASAGASGRHPSNVHRLLMRTFGTPQGAPEIDWVELDCSDGTRVPHPVVFPHKFFCSLYEERQASWELHVRGPAGAAGEFWSRLGIRKFIDGHAFTREESRGVVRLRFTL